jgi:hypothetical protein
MPCPASASTQPKRTPAVSVRSTSWSAIPGLVMKVRRSSGTPSLSIRVGSDVQLSGRNSRKAIGTGTSPQDSVSGTSVRPLAFLPSAHA